MLDELKMNKSKLVKVTKRLVAAIGDQIALDGAVFLDLAHRDKKTTQLVYVMTQQTACKGLGFGVQGLSRSSRGGEVHSYKGRRR